MVGQLVVEDEYTINVKLRRPVRDGGCLPPPTITIIPDTPAVTLTPPPHATLRQVQAAKSVNGALPVRVGCARRPRHAASDSHQPLSIMPPPPLRPCQQEAPAPEVTYGCQQEAPAPEVTYGCQQKVPAPKVTYGCQQEAPAPEVTDGCQQKVPAPKVTYGCQQEAPAPEVTYGCQQEVPAPKVTHGCLPLVQVYADDNSLVATNKYLLPSGSLPHLASPEDALTVPQGCQLAPGALYVPRIPAHCKSDSGVLYVPPVEQEKLRVRKMDEPPAKGNSRRVKKSSTVSQCQVAPSATGRGTRRSESSKAAARALLSEVLGARLEARPPSPRPPPPRPFIPHLSSSNNNQFHASNNLRNNAFDYNYDTASNNLRNNAFDYNYDTASNNLRNNAFDYNYDTASNNLRNNALDYNYDTPSNNLRNNALDYNYDTASNNLRNNALDYNHNTVSGGHDASLSISFGTPSNTGHVVTPE